MSANIVVSRRPHSSDSAPASDFFDEVADGSPPETTGDYPFIHKVIIDDDVFYGFTTGLPESREPWRVGYRTITRDTVLNAGTLEEVDGETAELVNGLLDLLAEQP